MTTKSISHGPNKDWLNIAHTSEARSKIRAWFKRERREENIIEGKMELERELKRSYIRLDEEQYPDLIEKLCRGIIMMKTIYMRRSGTAGSIFKRSCQG